jgi:hypothetical protein
MPRQTRMETMLRREIRASGRTLYRVAKDAGVGYASLHRLMKGQRSVSLAAFDKLCTCLDLELRRR